MGTRHGRGQASLAAWAIDAIGIADLRIGRGGAILILAPTNDEKGSKGSWLAANAEVTVCSRRDVYCEIPVILASDAVGIVEALPA